MSKEKEPTEKETDDGVTKEARIRGSNIGSEVEEEETARDTRVVSLEKKQEWIDKFYEKPTAITHLKKTFAACKPAKIHSEITEQNLHKCRYAEIPCTESTRVVLKQRSTFEDFIHANWMIMPDGCKYIATQGPIGVTDDGSLTVDGKTENDGSVDTREDFWHMVFMENVENIVMLCQHYEGTPLIRMCADYTPKRNFRHFGMYSIHRRSEPESIFDGVTRTMLEVKNQKTSRAIEVSHYQVPQWADNEVPKDQLSILKLHRLLKSKPSGHPIVVHGSAGIGRTGTFIGLDYCSQRIAMDSTLDMLALVQEMREMRSRCVQSHEHFLFLIYGITELFIEDGVPRTHNMHRLPDYFQKRKEGKSRKS